MIFTIELVTKLIGLGCRTYWSNPFDAFDGFTVLLGWLFVFLDAGSVAGVFRIGRIGRLIKRAPELRNLMSTLIETIPGISNVFMVMIVLLLSKLSAFVFVCFDSVSFSICGHWSRAVW